MSEILSNDLVIYIIVFFAGIVAYIISTLSGGGGSLLLVPVISLLIGGKSTAPVINLGNLIGEPVRIILFWKSIHWKIVKYYVPPAVVGTILSAWIFSSLNVEWLQIVVGIFLISSVFQYRFGKSERSFKMSLKAFMPLGFSVAFFSTLIGATGPVLNPFYLNYGLEKEKMIATKTINSFFVGLVQVSSYTALGSLTGNLWLYGLVLGLGASVGNWIGKRFLKKLSGEAFRKWVIVIMVISGVLMLVKQLGKIL
ncbi:MULTISPECIES: sulfite exporter TauE/SafE family protein [Pedobacter]|uniref:Probable membrane transporter protein n=2 Tax=Pedobacter TaxID=84567 RepID=A0A3N0BZ93_9SPHI|nr:MULTISPECIES: sulfite exporter TauE/SafE family protein [Pedobacter]RNL54606.1 sulfite exporter TauE/SafE family protein [Pedobacter jejuensis]GGI23363.1 membrane protein [Pedobacter mendelii]